MKTVFVKHNYHLSDRQIRSIIRARPKAHGQEIEMMLGIKGITLGELRRTLVELERHGLVSRTGGGK
jgi:DNA-binding HxlR family transcriptional regulator